MKSTSRHELNKKVSSNSGFTKDRYFLNELKIGVHKEVKLHSCEKFLFDIGFINFEEYFEHGDVIAFSDDSIFHHESSKL